MVEMAIFGAIALAALGFLIRTGMQMNFDQEIRMAAFRRAMAAARADNRSDQDSMGTVVHYVSDRRMPDPSDGLMSMPRVRTESSAYVEWGGKMTFANKPAANLDGTSVGGLGVHTQPRVIIRTNDREFRELYLEDFPNPLEQGTRVVRLGVSREGLTNNTVNSTATGSNTGSRVNPITQTHSETRLNTLAGDVAASDIGTNATVTW